MLTDFGFSHYYFTGTRSNQQ